MISIHCSRNSKEVSMTGGQWEGREAGEEVRAGSKHKIKQDLVGHGVDGERRAHCEHSSQGLGTRETRGSKAATC